MKYDFIIIGNGAAGFSAAIRANELKIKTAFIGGKATPLIGLGGTCINVGCVPSKKLIEDSKKFKLSKQKSIDYKKVVLEKNRLVTKLRKQKYDSVLEGLENIDYYSGLGKFIDSNKVKVGKNIIEQIILA